LFLSHSLEGVERMADVADDRVELLADWTVRDDDLGFVSQAHERTRLGLLTPLAETPQSCSPKFLTSGWS